VAALVAVAGIAGCGGSGGGDATKDALLTGFDGVANADRLTTTIHLDTTSEDLQKLGQASESPLDPQVATAIAAANIVIETVRGDDGTALDVTGEAGGPTLVEIRSVGDTLYLQGDVRGIYSLIGKESDYADLKAQTHSMPAFVQAAVDGQWVSLPASTLTSLANLGGGQSSSSGNGPRLLTELRRSIEQHATATEAGTDSHGTHYVLRADTRDLVKDLRAALQSAVPGGSVLSGRVPDNAARKTITFDAWVRDGAVTQLSIDLLQFSDAHGESPSTLPLVITFDRSGDDIAAPADATPVDLTQLGTLFGALTGGA
jgi:hypothetical protein